MKRETFDGVHAVREDAVVTGAGVFHLGEITEVETTRARNVIPLAFAIILLVFGGMGFLGSLLSFPYVDTIESLRGMAFSALFLFVGWRVFRAARKRVHLVWLRTHDARKLIYEGHDAFKAQETCDTVNRAVRAWRAGSAPKAVNLAAESRDAV